MNFQGLKKDNCPATLVLNKPGIMGMSTSPSSRSTKNKQTSDKRLQLLKSIKKKVKSGYYSSDEVIDDISDGFAKIFDNKL